MRYVSTGLILLTSLSASAAFAAAQQPSPQSPAALAALKAELNKDVQAEHSTKVNDPANPQPEKKQLIISPEQIKQISEEAGATPNPATDPKDIPVQGSAIGAMPAASTSENPAPKGNPHSPLMLDTTPINPLVPQSPAPAAPPPKAPEPVAAQLSDGTQALFRPDGTVSIITPDGRYHKPPDGIMTLRDGTTFSVENGARTE